METLKHLVAFLHERRKDIVTTKEVLVEVYDQTYGLHDPRSEGIEVVDFDALLKAIDDFSEEIGGKCHV